MAFHGSSDAQSQPACTGSGRGAVQLVTGKWRVQAVYPKCAAAPLGPEETTRSFSGAFKLARMRRAHFDGNVGPGRHLSQGAATRARPGDSQLVHAELKSRTVQTQPGGGAVRPRY